MDDGGANDSTENDSFGEDGAVTFGTGSGEARAVLVQDDGKILVAGTVGSAAALYRLEDDGTPDSGFGTDGLAEALSVSFSPYALALQTVGEDQYILIAGCLGVSGQGVARFDATGDVDDDFGTGENSGIALSGLTSSMTYGDLAVQSTGRIILGGTPWRYAGRLQLRRNAGRRRQQRFHAGR